MPESGTPPQSDTPVLGTRREPPSTIRGAQVLAGTEIRATVDTPLSTKTSKAGDQFTATVTGPVRSSNGDVAIPAGSKVRGEVSESEHGKTLPAIRGKAILDLRFREVTLPDGRNLPIVASLASLHSASGGSAGATTDAEGQVRDRTTGKEVAKDVGIGAGMGTVAGLILGSAFKGLAIGAIIGGGYVLATKGKEVNLPAQSGLVLKLDRYLVMPANAAP
jgi:hypothetical protein